MREPEYLIETRALTRRFGTHVAVNNLDHIGIIHESKLLFQGTLAELQRKQKTELTVGVNQPEVAIDCLVHAGWTVDRRDGFLSVRAKAQADAVKINRLLLDHRLDVFHLAVSLRSLEDIFLTLTDGQPARRDG